MTILLILLSLVLFTIIVNHFKQKKELVAEKKRIADGREILRQARENSDRTRRMIMDHRPMPVITRSNPTKVQSVIDTERKRQSSDDVIDTMVTVAIVSSMFDSSDSSSSYDSGSSDSSDYSGGGGDFSGGGSSGDW